MTSFGRVYRQYGRGKQLLWFPVVLHGWWACLLLVSPDPVGITAIHNTAITLHLGAPGLAVLFLVVSGTSIMALGQRTSWAILGILPQQALLMLSAEGALLCILKSQFADGVVRPWTFIAADQMPGILLALLHTIVLCDIFIVHRKFVAYG